MRGKYITLLGAEMSGKSTQIALLKKNLSDLNVASLNFHEPLDENIPFTTKLSDLTYASFGDVRPLTTALLYSAARVEIVEKEKELLDKGFWILSDRNYLDTIIYQHYVQGLNLEIVEQLVKFAQNGLESDLTILLDIDIETSKKRRLSGSNRIGNDKIDSFDDSFHQKVIDAYREEAKKRNWIVIDAAQRIDLISREILNKVRSEFNEYFQ